MNTVKYCDTGQHKTCFQVLSSVFLNVVKSEEGCGHKFHEQIVQRIVKILICTDDLNHLPFHCSSSETIMSILLSKNVSSMAVEVSLCRCSGVRGRERYSFRAAL